MQHIKNQYRALLLQFATFIIGQLILAVVLYFFIDPSKPMDNAFFRLTIPVLLISSIFVSQLYYKYNVRQLTSNLRSIENSLDVLDAQAENYSPREITDWFRSFKFLKTVQLYIIVGCNGIALIALMLTSTPHYFLYFFIGMTYFALVNPFITNFYKDFNLTENEKKLVESYLKN